KGVMRLHDNAESKGSGESERKGRNRCDLYYWRSYRPAVENRDGANGRSEPNASHDYSHAQGGHHTGAGDQAAGCLLAERGRAETEKNFCQSGKRVPG